ncbi:MAG: sugar kinase [Ignavibacteriales bacterium]|nr:sugar kinase [Ignavibacteriales bacterium]
MGLLVVGSIALDSVVTPFDKVENALGGSSTYITISASYFSAPIHLIGVIGSDFPEEHIKLFEKHEIDLGGLQIVQGGSTFRWGGKYHYDLNMRDTLFTQLNVFENFNPVIPENLRNSSFVLLGNIDPALQLKVLDQMKNPKFVVCDTMNLWIETKKTDLLKVLGRVDVLVINDSEARLLANEPNLIKSANSIMKLGPKYLIIKKGEHGALLFGNDTIFSAPAYPLQDIFDPTGAGDSFVGGFTGYLHKSRELDFESLKRAVIYGSTMASFCVEKFSTGGIEDLTWLKIHDRFIEFHELSRFADE